MLRTKAKKSFRLFDDRGRGNDAPFHTRGTTDKNDKRPSGNDFYYYHFFFQLYFCGTLLL